MTLRVIFDTCIYGELILESDDPLKIKEKIKSDKDFIIYGSPVIRKELKKAPDRIVLDWYDYLIRSQSNKERKIELTPKIEKLAKAYFNYRVKIHKKGKLSWKKHKEDFLIIASASLKNLDIVFSNDNKCMKNKHTLEAVRKVNASKRIRDPNFYDFDKLKEMFRL